jgi:hypothetical protein
MCATAANLIERVLPPESSLRQWVLTFPFSWRRRLAGDGALLGRLTRIFLETVHCFYAERAAMEGASGAQTGSVTVVQRTLSDLRLAPHLHAVVLDGAWHEADAELRFEGLGHLKTSEVGDVLARVVCRMEKHLRRRGLLRMAEDDGQAGEDPEGHLAASAVSGQTPPAGPQWRRGLPRPEPEALSYQKPLCASLCGFTLHAATRAGALDREGREALLRYVLRPPLAQDRVLQLEDGLVRIELKKPYADGTVAVDMDPLSLLSRLATSVPPPRYHTVRYAGVLAAAHPWRPRITAQAPDHKSRTKRKPRVKQKGSADTYRPWAELLKRTFAIDALECPKCHGRMQLIALLRGRESIVGYRRAIGEATEVPARSPKRGPPYWKSQLLRRQALGRPPAGGQHAADDEPA